MPHIESPGRRTPPALTEIAVSPNNATRYGDIPQGWVPPQHAPPTQHVADAPVPPALRPIRPLPRRGRLRIADLLNPQPDAGTERPTLQAQDLAGGMVLTGPHRSRTPHPGRKMKYDARVMLSLDLPINANFSRLVDTASHLKLTLTPTLTRGAFGKLRLARRDDGVMVAVKELRTRHKAGWDHFGVRRTTSLSMGQIMKEAADTQGLRQIIDRGMSVYDAWDAPAGERLHGICLGAPPFAVFDVLHTAPSGKVYMVMHREAGDMALLDARLPQNMRFFAALSLAAQGFSELSCLHDHAHIAHLDIKLENFLFNASGQIKLFDFGTVAPLRDGQSQRTGRHGTLLAPEMLAHHDGNAAEPLTLGSATDVWAMAATVLALSQGPFEQTPFYAWPSPLPRARDPIPAAAMLVQFSLWQQSLRPTPDAPMDVNRIQPNDYFGSHFYKLAKTFPSLSHILLNDAFLLNPSDRRSASEIAAKIRRLLPQRDNIYAQRLRHLMAWVDENENDLNQTQAQLAKFAAWAQRQPGG